MTSTACSYKQEQHLHPSFSVPRVPTNRNNIYTHHSVYRVFLQTATTFTPIIQCTACSYKQEQHLHPSFSVPRVPTNRNNIYTHHSVYRVFLQTVTTFTPIIRCNACSYKQQQHLHPSFSAPRVPTNSNNIYTHHSQKIVNHAHFSQAFVSSRRHRILPFYRDANLYEKMTANDRRVR